MARADRTGKRIPRSAFKKRIPDLGRYFIYTDADETEENYMYGLRDSLPKEFQGRIVIKVSKTKTEKLIEACREQVSLQPQYCEPWIVFDRDEVPNFDRIIRDAERCGIHVGWSNPCIEIWFDAYFGTMHTDWLTSPVCCQRFGNIFEKRTGQEYIKSNPQNYNLLTRFGDENTAIQIAEKRLQHYLSNGQTTPSKMCPCTTLHHLVGEILRKAVLSKNE